MTSKLSDLTRYLSSCGAPADLEILAELLAELGIDRTDLQEYCHFGTETYRRNMISHSEWYELLAICWRPGHVSPIHDHAGSSCAFKIVEGRACETIYDLSGPGRVRASGKKYYAQGEICVSSADHIHRVSNERAAGSDLITLHIYSPPLHMGLYRVDTGFESPPEQSAK